MLKILQVRLQQYANWELPDVQAGLEKAEEPEIKLPTSIGSSKKQESSRNTSTSALLTMLEVFDYVDHNKLWKMLKRWKYQTTWPASSEICMPVKKQVRTGRGTTDCFQIGKGVPQGYILSPCLLNLYSEYIMRNAGLDEAQARIKIAGRNINNLGYADDNTLMSESEEELRSFLMKVKEEYEKAGLKLNIQKTKIMASSPVPSLHGK